MSQGQVSVQGTVTCTSQSWVTQLSQAGLGLYPSAAPPWDPAGLRGCRCQHSPTPWHCLPCVILSLSPDQCQFFRNAMSALFKHSPGPGQGFGSGTDGAQQLFSCQPSFQPALVQQEGGTHQGDLSVTLSVLQLLLFLPASLGCSVSGKMGTLRVMFPVTEPLQ